ncbi:hypothetical protein [Marinisporobacter balticus]|uniref:Uncharacterized protein n=1 Tax=Marinisporobacter balticus TaxID=2018667 RepID=A0A4R2KDW6_9FIRM|nr:hypothetical protein [Marinisporobacter balticus]TCO68078.1 hypothetical protein EV214_14912 [Marinisporobacter balticus]
MTFIDEKIAALKQTKRILQEEENQSKDMEIKDDEKKQLSLEEVVECIEDGYLEMENRKIHFKRGIYLDGKISIPMIENYFEEVANDDKTLAFKNEIDGVSFTCSYMKENILDMSFDAFKKGMEKNFKQMDLYLEWIDEGEIKKEDIFLNYGIFKTPTAKGYIYNVIFFSKDHTNTQLILGNFNCFYKDINIWEKVIKGLIHLLEIKM